MGVQLGVAVTTTVSVHAIETPSKRTHSPINTFMSKNPLSSSVPYHVPRMAPFERIEVRLRTLLGGFSTQGIWKFLCQSIHFSTLTAA